MTIYTRLGSVSTATLLMEDLIPAFMDCLDALNDEIASSGDGSSEAVGMSQRITKLLAEIETRQKEPEYYTSQESQYDYEDLCNLLEEFAPPYCYFGSHPGDGADIGFWPSLDSIEEDARYGEGIIKVSSLEEVPDDATGFIALVTDHGNLTLYQRNERGRLKEVWSVV